MTENTTEETAYPEITDSSTDPWACTLCYPGSIEYGLISPGVSLIKTGKEYHLVGGQGHREDIIATIKIKPSMDPLSDEEQDRIFALADAGEKPSAEDEALLKLSAKWFDEVNLEENFGWVFEYNQVDYLQVWTYMEGFIKAGYGNGRVENWAFQRCGELLEKNPQGLLL